MEVFPPTACFLSFISAFPAPLLTTPLFCCCLWHSFVWNANEIGQLDYIERLDTFIVKWNIQTEL